MKTTIKRLALAALLLLPAACAKDIYVAGGSDDPRIKAQVLRRIKAAGQEINVSKVAVDVHVGVVTLSGLVSSDEERAALADAARRVPGVDQVVVNLLVQQ